MNIYENLDLSYKLTDASSEIILHSQDKWQALNGDVINIFTSPNEEALTAKCLQTSTPLGQLCKITVGLKPYQTGKGIPKQTKETVKNRPFDANRKVDSSYSQYLRGADINRYTIDPLKSRYIKYGVWLAEPRPSAEFDSPVKILVRQTGDSIISTLDTDKFLCLNNLHVVVPNQESPDPKFLLGILNSSLITWFYHMLNPEIGEALAEVKKANVAKLPIRNIDLTIATARKNFDRMVEFVNAMLDLNKKLQSANTPHEKETLQRRIDATDHQIDRLVYELYDLTDEEIGIVEGEE